VIDFAQVRWEIFNRTRTHRYLCLDDTKYWWIQYYKGVYYQDFPCGCDSGNKKQYLNDLIIVEKNITLN
jgi:hypothetical protein